jgi:PadR family transcriptional regulator PadR
LHDSYGFEIYKSIREATGGACEIKEATLSASYRRLVRDGLAEPYWGGLKDGIRDNLLFRVAEIAASGIEPSDAARRATGEFGDIRSTHGCHGRTVPHGTARLD